MDRCAVFVDAGHLLAEGGKLCCGTPERRIIRCDYASLTTALLRLASDRCQLPALRLYWYDAAPDAIPTREHLGIAELSGVKLRLGRLVGTQQKGVDSLIVRDLMTLARERAATTIFLLGGDEDLREGVVAAQEMGVLVVVLGIPATQQGNQAKSLIRDADEHVVLETAFLAPFFARAEEEVPIASRPSAQSGAEIARHLGQEFALEWAGSATADELRNLLAAAPIIPMALDVQLLSTAERELGPLRERPDLKKDLRSGFWGALKRFGEQPSG